ncbi:MAG: rRNA maturation RNase YbeY [Lishizhenia sp.]
MVSFIEEDKASPVLDHKRIVDWLANVVSSENKDLGEISIITGSDEWLLGFNIKYLNHDYFTDIISFDYCEDKIVSGDLLISVDRVIENAQLNNVSRETEFLRVCVHGVLHLCGYGDKSSEEVVVMRKKEDYYLCSY